MVASSRAWSDARVGITALTLRVNVPEPDPELGPDVGAFVMSLREASSELSCSMRWAA